VASFDQRTAIALTGTLTNGNVSLTSTAVDGQVITLAGSITEKSGFRIPGPGHMPSMLAVQMATKETAPAT
jgi:hypothetical protein